MSAAPGDRPRDDSFEDRGSPSTETKDGDAKHVVSLRRQDPTPSDDAPAPVDDEQPEVAGSPDDVQPPTPAAKRRWRKAKHAVSLLNPANLLKKKPVDQTPTGGQLLTMTAQRAAPTRSSWHKTPAKIKRTSSSDSTSSTLAKEKRQRLRKLKRARSRTTFTDLIGLFEKQDDDIEKELLDDMRSNKFPRHRAHWLIMDPLQKWRLKWDILMMLMICFVMIVTPFELAFVSAVGWAKNYTPFPNKLISASRRVETPSRH
jgi:hypothetical protein